MSAPPKERRPWPMKWIVVAILLVLVPYTFLTLRYRKPGPAFRPYEDTKNRANTVRLLSAGYQRISLGAIRPATASAAAAAAPVAPAPGGLPAGLRGALVEPPRLPAEILHVAAAPSASRTSAYPIHFTCALPDNKQQLAGAELYVRGEEVVITPDFEKLAGSLLSRSRESAVLLTLPPGALKPGRYRVTLVGTQSSRAWTLTVR